LTVSTKDSVKDPVPTVKERKISIPVFAAYTLDTTDDGLDTTDDDDIEMIMDNTEFRHREGLSVEAEPW